MWADYTVIHKHRQVFIFTRVKTHYSHSLNANLKWLKSLGHSLITAKTIQK